MSTNVNYKFWWMYLRVPQFNFACMWKHETRFFGVFFVCYLSCSPDIIPFYLAVWWIQIHFLVATYCGFRSPIPFLFLYQNWFSMGFHIWTTGKKTFLWKDLLHNKYFEPKNFQFLMAFNELSLKMYRKILLQTQKK